MSLKTADYNLKKYPNVYEPSEDSFLFLDALESELGCIENLQPTTAVEIGCGSGIVIASLATAIKNCSYFATDINLEACKATNTTSKINKVQLETVQMDLLSCYKPNTLDLIIFNPPYVVTDSSELKGNGLNRAWAGGHNGRETIDKLLPQIPKLLSHNGIFYLLLLKENKPDEVIAIMRNFNYNHSIVKERKILGEYLYIIKFYK